MFSSACVRTLTIKHMRLANALCRFVELAEPSSAAVGRGAPLCSSLITPGHQRVSELREKMGITGNSWEAELA